jgi:hypothetical protein
MSPLMFVVDRTSLIEIIVLMSNLVFQNDSISAEAKDALGILILLLILCLLVTGVGGEIYRKFLVRKQKRTTGAQSTSPVTATELPVASQFS